MGSRNILILRNGGENKCSALVKDYIGRYTNFEEKLIDNDSFEERKQDCFNRTLVVLICRVHDRLELFQDRMVSQLSGDLRQNLVVIYVVSRDLPNPYSVANSSELTTQINASLENFDRNLIENTLNRSLNITLEKTRPKNFFSFGLFGVMLTVFCLMFMKPENGKSVIPKFDNEIPSGSLNDLKSRVIILEQKAIETSQILDILQKENQDIRLENEVYKEKIEELERLLGGFIFFSISSFLLLIAKMFFKKVTALFKKGEQDDTETLNEKYLNPYSIQAETATKNLAKSGGSLDDLADGQSENGSTESSVQTIELEEVEKPVADGSKDRTIESLARAKAFSDEKYFT